MIEFRDIPDGTETQRELRRVVDQINGSGLRVTLENFRMIVGENPVAHGQVGRVPVAVSLTACTAGMDLRRSRASDERCVYVTSSAVGTADLVIHF